MNINSNTNTICLLGHPIKHSFSPTIHNYLFEGQEQFSEYVIKANEVCQNQHFIVTFPFIILYRLYCF